MITTAKPITSTAMLTSVSTFVSNFSISDSLLWTIPEKLCLSQTWQDFPSSHRPSRLMSVIDGATLCFRQTCVCLIPPILPPLPAAVLRRLGFSHVDVSLLSLSWAQDFATLLKWSSGEQTVTSGLFLLWRSATIVPWATCFKLNWLPKVVNFSYLLPVNWDVQRIWSLFMLSVDDLVSFWVL